MAFPSSPSIIATVNFTAASYKYHNALLLSLLLKVLRKNLYFYTVVTVTALSSFVETEIP